MSNTTNYSFAYICEKINGITNIINLQNRVFKISTVESDDINFFDTSINIILLFIQFLFIIGITLFSFSTDNISILGGFTKFSYIILFIVIIIKLLLTFSKYYINKEKPITIDDKDKTTFDTEMKLYESIYKLFINMPSDIPFIILVSLTLSSLSMITNNKIVSEIFSKIILVISIPLFVLFLILLLLRKYLNAYTLLYSNIFYMLVYIVLYFILISLITGGIQPILSTLFTKKQQIDNENNENNETNISENLYERFLIFQDPSPGFDEDSKYYYIVGLILYILLILSQIVIVKLFSDNEIVTNVKLLFNIFIDKVFEYLELPKTKKQRLQFQKKRMERSIKKIDHALQDHFGGGRSKK